MKSPVSSPVPEVRPTRSRLAEAVPLARCDEFNPRGQPCSPAQIKAEPAAYASGNSGRRAPPAPPLSAIANDAVTGGEEARNACENKEEKPSSTRGWPTRPNPVSPAALDGHPDRPRRAPAMDRRLGAPDRGARLAHLPCELYLRLEIAHRAGRGRMALPLSHAVFADVLGFPTSTSIGPSPCVKDRDRSGGRDAVSRSASGRPGSGRRG